MIIVRFFMAKKSEKEEKNEMVEEFFKQNDPKEIKSMQEAN